MDALKVLIVYGASNGATTDTAGAIAQMFRDEGHSVTLVNAEQGPVASITGYDLVVVGSGIQKGQWANGPEQFLQQFQGELRTMKVVLFVSSAMQAIYARENNLAEMASTVDQYLQSKVKTYGLSPISLAVLGGIFPYDMAEVVAQKPAESIWQKFEEAGFEKVDGGYDTRDWMMIEVWALDLIDKVQGVS